MANVCQPKRLFFYWELANGSILVAAPETDYWELSADEFADRYASLFHDPDAPSFGPEKEATLGERTGGAYADGGDIKKRAIEAGAVKIVDPSKL